MPRARRRALVALMLPALAACASPQVRCERAATSDLRTVTELIAETEATLERGYAWRTEERTVRVGLTGCIGGGGLIYTGVCAGEETRTVRRPVAVDLDAERRKLDSLRRKQAELRAEAAVAVAQCRAAAGG